MEFVIFALWLCMGSGALLTAHAYVLCKVCHGGHDDNDGDVVVDQNGNTGSKNMGKVDLKKLPCFEYKTGEKINGPDMDCVVCLESFKMGDQCKLLPTCKHTFHAQCIDSWLMKTPNCPICRTCENSQQIDVLSNADTHVV